MSVKAMARVWDMTLPPNHKLVLLAMADHADHDGRNIFPGIPKIAAKTGYSEMQVRRVIKKLIESQVLIVDSIRPGKTTIYHLANASQNDPPQNVTPNILSQGDGDTPNISSREVVLNHQVLNHQQPADTDVSVVSPPPADKNPEPVKGKIDTPIPALPPTGTPKTVRIPAAQMNPMKDAIVAAFKWSWDAMTSSAKGMVQSAAKQLCEVGYKPEDIPKIYTYCQKEFENFTPMALAKHAHAWKAKANVRVPSWRDGIIAIDGVPL